MSIFAVEAVAEVADADVAEAQQDGESSRDVFSSEDVQVEAQQDGESFPALAGPAEDLAPTLAQLVLHRADLGDLPQPEPIIEDTLDARTVAVLAGRNSTGKSFLALDWSCSIATGKAWQGRPVHLPGRVLYIAAEGAHGLDQRVSAWEHAWQRQVEALDVLPLPVNLFTGTRFGELRRLVVEADYRLVVLDTWARSTVGGQENNNSDSTAAFERVDQLRQTGTSVLVVAHTDAGDNKTRGATALDDNADTVYRMKGDPALLELRRDKRKDGPRDDFHQLRLKAVLDSCVLENVRGQDHALNGRAEDLLSVFRECFADNGCSKAELRNVAGQAPATFARSLKSLVQRGVLLNAGSDQRPFYKPGASNEQ